MRRDRCTRQACPGEVVNRTPARGAGSYDLGMAAYTLSTSRMKLTVLAFGCFLFAAVGVLVALAGGAGIVMGIAAILFFGVFGGVSVVMQWRRRLVLRADDRGIAVGAGGFIPWADVEQVSAARLEGAPGGVEVLALRLHRAAAYAASLSEREARWMLRFGAVMGAKRRSGRRPPPQTAPSPLGTTDEPQLTPLQRDVVAMLARVREETGGWDLAWAAFVLPVRADAAAEELERRRRSAEGGEAVTQ